MKPSPGSLAHLESRPSADVESWLAQGFLKFVRRAGGDPFIPHSFVNNSPHPVEAIQDLYAVASFDLQRALHRGIEMLGALCRTTSHESEDLLPKQRLALLQAFLALCTNTGCTAALQTVALIACQEESDWGPKLFREKIFPECILCLEDLALDFNAYAHKTAGDRVHLISALHQLVQREQFQPRFAPRLLAALVSVDPEGLLDHLILLGTHVARMHRQDREQAQLAYLTAQRIVDRTLFRLRAIFPYLDFGSSDSRDHWLFLALFGEKGPLKAVNIGREDAMAVFISGRSDSPMTFHHEGLMQIMYAWLPDSDLPEPALDHQARALMVRAASGSREFFGPSKRNYDHAVPKPH